jgi:hypothetical protein
MVGLGKLSNHAVKLALFHLFVAVAMSDIQRKQ